MLSNVANSPAFRWYNGVLAPVAFSPDIQNTKLIGVNNQNEILRKNVIHFLKGGRALNTLMWGEKGTGKSTLVRLLARDFFNKGLRIIEFCGMDYLRIYELYDAINHNPKYSFIFYFDDISFNKDDEEYKGFKNIIEGGIEEKPRNTIFIATSHRRHLVFDDDSKSAENENTSLSARFGLTLGFSPVSDETYLQIVSHYMHDEKIDITDWGNKALAYASDRGGKTGRLAQQFVLYHKILSTKIQ